MNFAGVCDGDRRVPDRIGAAEVPANNGRIESVPDETIKQRAIQALQTLPEDATIDDAIERLCLIAKIEEGLRQSDAGQLTDHAEVEKRFLA